MQKYRLHFFILCYFFIFSNTFSIGLSSEAGINGGFLASLGGTEKNRFHKEIFPGYLTLGSYYNLRFNDMPFTVITKIFIPSVHVDFYYNGYRSRDWIQHRFNFSFGFIWHIPLSIFMKETSSEPSRRRRRNLNRKINNEESFKGHHIILGLLWGPTIDLTRTKDVQNNAAPPDVEQTETGLSLPVHFFLGYRYYTTDKLILSYQIRLIYSSLESSSLLGIGFLAGIGYRI